MPESSGGQVVGENILKLRELNKVERLDTLADTESSRNIRNGQEQHIMQETLEEEETRFSLWKDKIARYLTKMI